MAANKCPKRALKRSETVEEMRELKEKARTFSFAELAEQGETETLLFKSLIVAAEHMDEVERLRAEGEKWWTTKLSPVRVGFWKAFEGWAKVAHPDFLTKPTAPKTKKKAGRDDEEEEIEVNPPFVPDLTMPTEPVIWRDVLHWEKGNNFPVIRDTGIRTETIVSYLLDKGTVEILLGYHRELSMTDVIACQEFDKEDQIARADYIKNYRDNQRMSPLHPDFIRARSYPKTPRPQYGPALGLIVGCLLFLGGLVVSREVAKQEGNGRKVEVVHDRAEAGKRLTFHNAQAVLVGRDRRETGEKTLADRFGRDAKRLVELKLRHGFRADPGIRIGDHRVDPSLAEFGQGERADGETDLREPIAPHFPEPAADQTLSPNGRRSTIKTSPRDRNKADLNT